MRRMWDVPGRGEKAVGDEGDTVARGGVAAFSEFFLVTYVSYLNALPLLKEFFEKYLK